MAEPTETQWLTCTDLAYGCALCSDYACNCEEVYGVTLSEEQEAALWLWIASVAGRPQS
jgi:hypothetical protein